MLQGCPTPADTRCRQPVLKGPLRQPALGMSHYPQLARTSCLCSCLSLLLLSPLSSHHHALGPNSPHNLRWVIQPLLPKSPQAQLEANTSSGSTKHMGHLLFQQRPWLYSWFKKKKNSPTLKTAVVSKSHFLLFLLFWWMVQWKSGTWTSFFGLNQQWKPFFIAGVWSMVCAFNFSKLRIKFPNYALTGGLALLVYSASYLGFKTERVFSLKSWPAHSPTPDTRPTGHSPRPHLVEELSVK